MLDLINNSAIFLYLLIMFLIYYTKPNLFKNKNYAIILTLAAAFISYYIILLFKFNI